MIGASIGASPEIDCVTASMLSLLFPEKQSLIIATETEVMPPAPIPCIALVKMRKYTLVDNAQEILLII